MMELFEVAKFLKENAEKIRRKYKETGIIPGCLHFDESGMPMIVVKFPTGVEWILSVGEDAWYVDSTEEGPVGEIPDYVERWFIRCYENIRKWLE